MATNVIGPQLTRPLGHIIIQINGKIQQDGKACLYLEQLLSLQMDQLLKLAQVNAMMRDSRDIKYEDLIYLMMDEKMTDKVKKFVFLNLCVFKLSV